MRTLASFVTVLAEKMSTIKSLPDAKREQLRAAAEKLVGEQIYPAWKKEIEVLQAQLAKATDDAGLWRLKGGAEAYAYNLHHFTTTNLTAAQVHEIGLQQVAHLEGEMDGLLKRLGRTQGPVKDRIDKLDLDMRYPNPASEESRAQIMRDIDGILADAQKRAALLFDLVPKTPVVAQPFPRFREAAPGPAASSGPRTAPHTPAAPDRCLSGSGGAARGTTRTEKTADYRGHR